jgi:hypothetical protein
MARKPLPDRFYLGKTADFEPNRTTRADYFRDAAAPAHLPC